MMKFQCSIVINLVLLQCLVVLVTSQGFDFFYLVQQWPGSYCDTQQSCCYPTTGKPAADFLIHGMWPYQKDGSDPSGCSPDSHLDPAEISDLKSSMQKNWPTLACPSSDGQQFWSEEWEKHGACSTYTLDQHNYFEYALRLKQKTNLLQALRSSGISPGGSYSLKSIKAAITDAVGFTPWIECNKDSSGNYQLYQVYLCANTAAIAIIDCPVFPKGACPSEVKFPSF